jgi:glyoxylase-like metal-dependent hydrolase (beta-lactamase superfamily II)
LCAAFPRAEYIVQRGELQTGTHLNERTRASYMAADFEPLAADGRLRLVDGDVALDRHVQLRRAPGHTPHMQIVLVVTREGTVAFLADLVPTASHVRYPYIMAYDLEPLTTLAGKKAILPRAAAERWWIVFEHDTQMPLAQLFEQDGKLVARPGHPEA